MWSAIVRRRSGGSQSQETQFIELSDDDCKLLVSAGLKIQKGASPRDLYCFQYLPTYYDGTPLQVLRLLEEVKAAGRQVRRAVAQQAKRQRLSATGEYASSSSSKSLSSSWRSTGQDVDVELLDDNEQENAGQEGQLPELIKIRSFSVASKAPASPVKGSARYETIETPVKPSASRSSSPVEKNRTPQTTTSRRSQRSSMKIDVVSVHEESSSSRKRKSSETTSTSPLAALFSPHGGIKTPSPGLKTRRTSVLKEFESPDQSDENATPPTAPGQPKRISLTSEYTESVTKRFTSAEWDDDDEASAHDGLVDDNAEDDERGCCDVKSVVEPILEVLHRTSSRVQNAWEEYSKVTPTTTKKTKAASKASK